MFGPEDLPGVDRKVALRVISTARTFAPCLDSLDGVAKEAAEAILEGVAAELPAAGGRRVRSQSRNGTSISLDSYISAFSDDDRAALGALCGIGPSLAASASPVGCFPPAGVVESLWPER